MKTLILGGVRSGKSQLAETMAEQTGASVCYVATARADDAEMRERILAHQQRRPSAWTDVEVPLALAEAIRKNAKANRCLLVDCLSLWVTNLLLDDDETRVETEIIALLQVLRECPGELIFVSNESNMGVVPMGELSRRYCDVLGLLHQNVAKLSDRVILTVAGLPHYLKGVAV